MDKYAVIETIEQAEQLQLAGTPVYLVDPSPEHAYQTLRHSKGSIRGLIRAASGGKYYAIVKWDRTVIVHHPIEELGYIVAASWDKKLDNLYE